MSGNKDTFEQDKSIVENCSFLRKSNLNKDTGIFDEQYKLPETPELSKEDQLKRIVAESLKTIDSHESKINQIFEEIKQIKSLLITPTKVETKQTNDDLSSYPSKFIDFWNVWGEHLNMSVGEAFKFWIKQVHNNDSDFDEELRRNDPPGCFQN